MIDPHYIFTLYAKGARAVLHYLEQLDKRIEDAEARVHRSQQAQLDLLSKGLAQAKQTLALQTEELIRQRQLNHQLQRRIRELEHEIESGGSRGGGETARRDSHNSSLPPSLDLPWKKVKRTRSLRKKSGRKAGGQHGHPGQTLRQAAQPDEVILHTPSSCHACGSSLEGSQTIGCQRRQVFYIPEAPMKVREHRAETRSCPSCGATTKASFPAEVKAPVQYGVGVLSRAVYLNLYQLIPVARACETMRDLFGCPISPATLQRAGRFCSGKLVRCEQRIKAAIRDSEVIGADETGLRVAGSGGWVHVTRTEELTHFAYDERRWPCRHG